MKKKIGIINWWRVNNYGAFLLSFALQKTIHSLGYDVENIDYLPDEISNPLKLSMVKRIGIMRTILRAGYFVIYYSLRQLPFSNIRKKLNISSKRYIDNTLHNIVGQYDKIMIGGDQLWSTKRSKYFRLNFLPFVKEKYKKICYAASIAQNDIPFEFREEFYNNVSRFGYITSREDESTILIEKYAKSFAPRVADPAFLLSSHEYRLIEEPDRRQVKPFVFVYHCAYDVSLTNAVDEYAKSNNCEIIYCPFPLLKQIHCKRKPAISPERWLWYIDNATCVFTDSFHGTAYSIILNTQFFSQISKEETDTGSRILQILKTYSLESRLVGDFGKINNQPDIDWDIINGIIGKERENAMFHLRAMLEI